MISQELFHEELMQSIENGLREDVGTGDHSSLCCIPANAQGIARLYAKEDTIIAGVSFAQMIWKYVDSNLETEIIISDGQRVKTGDCVLEIRGNQQQILKTERLVLNAMQRMSAIATKTADYVKLLEGTNTKLLDTRKTTPGIRALEKWAVKIGGGVNHRFALYDEMMLKDNHIDFVGGVTQAIQRAKEYIEQKHLDINIIVEARNFEEIKQILSCGGVSRILLDNFSPSDTQKAVSLIDGRMLTESSGNINQQTIRNYALCGVDYISCGAITHSVSNIDLSLKVITL